MDVISLDSPPLLQEHEILPEAGADHGAKVLVQMAHHEQSQALSEMRAILDPAQDMEVFSHAI